MDNIKLPTKHKLECCLITMCTMQCIATIYSKARYPVSIHTGVLADTRNALRCPIGKHISAQVAVLHTAHLVLNKHSRYETIILWHRKPYDMYTHPDSKFHGANMGPSWVLSARDGAHVGPMNLVIRACMNQHLKATTHFFETWFLTANTVLFMWFSLYEADPI